MPLACYNNGQNNSGHSHGSTEEPDQPHVKSCFLLADNTEQSKIAGLCHLFPMENMRLRDVSIFSYAFQSDPHHWCRAPTLACCRS